MFWMKWLVGAGVAWSLLPGRAFAEAPANESKPQVQLEKPAYAKMPPYRTWITIENYTIENNGDPKQPISNVRLEVRFPGDKRMELPENGEFWPIGNGQRQDIKRTFEIPWEAIANDGFNFVIQMVRRGSKMLPCQFNVTQLSQYNRSYFCHTDIQWQYDQKVPEDKMDKEGIQVRVFTDLNTPLKDRPKDAIALR